MLPSPEPDRGLVRVSDSGQDLSVPNGLRPQAVATNHQAGVLVEDENDRIVAANRNLTELNDLSLDAEILAGADSRTVSTLRLRQLEATGSVSESRTDHVTLKADGSVHRVPYARIQYIEAQGDYLSVKTDDRSYFVHGTMKAMHASLPTHEFIRIHRSYVVRRDRIERIRATSLEVAGSKLPVGVTYKSAVRLSLNPPRLQRIAG